MRKVIKKRAQGTTFLLAFALLIFTTSCNIDNSYIPANKKDIEDINETMSEIQEQLSEISKSFQSYEDLNDEMKKDIKTFKEIQSEIIEFNENAKDEIDDTKTEVKEIKASTKVIMDSLEQCLILLEKISSRRYEDRVNYAEESLRQTKLRVKTLEDLYLEIKERLAKMEQNTADNQLKVNVSTGIIVAGIFIGLFGLYIRTVKNRR